MANTTAKVEHLPAKHTVDKNLLDDVRRAFTLHKTASQQPAAVDAKDGKKLPADKVAIDTELGKFWEDMQARVNSIEVFLDDKVKR